MLIMVWLLRLSVEVRSNEKSRQMSNRLRKSGPNFFWMHWITPCWSFLRQNSCLSIMTQRALVDLPFLPAYMIDLMMSIFFFFSSMLAFITKIFS